MVFRDEDIYLDMEACGIRRLDKEFEVPDEWCWRAIVLDPIT
jgi:hypothetical protein